MPATRTNYLVWYEGESQVYGSGGLEVALSSPPPKGQDIKNKRVGFLTHRPDDGKIVIHELPEEEVQNAEIKLPASRAKTKKSG